MVTKTQLTETLVAELVTVMKANDTTATYHAAIDRARDIVLTPHQIELVTTGKYAGQYKVCSQSAQGSYYMVNGRCRCPAAAREPHNVCKHWIAVQIVQQVQQRVADLIKEGTTVIPHEHKYKCGHAEGRISCWDTQCKDIVSVLCEACVQAKILTPDPAPPMRVCDPDPEEEPEHLSSEHGCGEGCPACNDDDAEVIAALVQTWDADMTLDDVSTAAPLRTEQYEKPPAIAAKTLAPSVHVPEAPASLNLKIKLAGGHELMYTMRSMQTGTAGDEELLARLPVLMAGLEAVVEEDGVQRQGWLSRFFGHLVKCVTE